MAGYCDLLIDKAGAYHVVFQESPAIGKPVFIYYSTSSDKGNSWSKPVSLSNDNTGNGSGSARILQDGSGMIYAIWKRYGNTTDQYPVDHVLLDGPGGYTLGTVFYSVLQGGTWSQPIRINETQRVQDSWFATVTPQGKVAVFWAQMGPAAIKQHNGYWWYCDYVRTATLNGTTPSAITNYSKPWEPATQYEQMPYQGYINLDGYVDAAGHPHIVYEKQSTDGVQQVTYLDGKNTRVIYSYPKYSTNNTFSNPAKLLVDEKGVDHVILLPLSSMLESEQVWDMNQGTNATTIIFNFKDSGSKISGFQASQGPAGKIAVVVEARYKTLDNDEAYGCFYENGVWQFGGLTRNASKDDFKSTEFRTFYGTGYFASLTTYHSRYASVAWDATGSKRMAMNLDAYWIGGGGYSISSPSIVYVPIDR